MTRKRDKLCFSLRREGIAVIALLFMAGASGALASCDRSVGQLEIAIVTSPLPSQNPFPEESDFIRLRVEGPGMGVMTREFPYVSGGAGRLPDVPIGEERVITLEVFNRSGSVISYGRSLPLTIESGDNEVTLYVALVSRSSLGAEGGSAGTARGWQQAMPLRDGRVVFIGGGEALERSTVSPRGAIRAVDIFDPTSSLVIDAGVCAGPDGGVVPGSEPLCLRFLRLGAAMTRMASGDIIIAGGEDDDSTATRVVERLARGRWTFDVVGGPLGARIDAAIVPTKQGGAVMLGGWTGAGTVSDSLVLFSASGERFDELPNPSECPRAGGAVAMVGQTTVLFGGEGDEGLMTSYGMLPLGAEVPVETCVPLPGGITPRTGAVSAVVDGRYAIFMGGLREGGIVSDEVDLFDSETGIFCNVGALNAPRYLHAAVALPRSRVLVIGGVRSLETLSPGSTEILDLGLLFAELRRLPEEIPNPCISLSGNLLHAEVRMSINRIAPVALGLDNGMYLVAGGFDGTGAAVGSVELYVPER